METYLGFIARRISILEKTDTFAERFCRNIFSPEPRGLIFFISYFDSFLSLCLLVAPLSCPFAHSLVFVG